MFLLHRYDEQRAQAFGHTATVVKQPCLLSFCYLLEEVGAGAALLG